MRQRHSTSYRKSASRSTAIDRSLPRRTGGLDFQSYRNKRKRRTRLNAPPSVFDTSVSRTAGLMVCGLDHWNPCSSNPTVPNRRKNLQGGCLSIRIIDFSRMTIYHLITAPRRPLEGVCQRKSTSVSPLPVESPASGRLCQPRPRCLSGPKSKLSLHFPHQGVHCGGSRATLSSSQIK